MLDIARPEPELAERYRREGYWRGEVLGSLMRDVVKGDGSRVAVVDARGRYTYAELDHRADALAAGFLQAGIAAGDRVVVQLPNCVAFAHVAIALFRLGAVPVFALPNYRRNEVTYLCECTEAVAYVTVDTHLGFDHVELARQAASACKSLKHIFIEGEAREFVPLGEVAAPARDLAPPRPSDVAFFLLSGGTTGLPKLIPRTHDDYAYQIRATAEGLGFDENGVYLAAIPFGNASLGCPGLLGALRVGGKVVMLTSPNPEQAFPAIRAEGATLTTLMPPMVARWLEAFEPAKLDLSRLILQVGSQRFAPELARRARLELQCRVTHWFGMAEGLLTFTRLDAPPEVVDCTQGKPLCPADEVRVVDSGGREVRRGELGELLTRGPYTLRGYYKAADHNARAFTADGFLRTGDLVRITPAGDMIVEGRLKDVINRGGEKISAAEVEDLLIEHPKVFQAAVVAAPDVLLGERVAMFVVPRKPEPALPELRGFLKDRGLADYKVPDLLHLVDALPCTRGGKVDKARLRELLRDRTLL